MNVDKSAKKSSPFPYPWDTRAKGWRFELDYERIRRSDTWTLAPLDVRPWLLMLWMVAWEQEPCGTLPPEDALIAARIGMRPKLFAKHRGILLRGWREIDGRLFHPVLTERVTEMLNQREKRAKRVADYRARKNGADGSGDVTRYTPATNPLETGAVTGDKFVSNHTVTTPEPEPEPEPGPGPELEPELVRKKERVRAPVSYPHGLDLEAWNRWQAYRLEIRRPLKTVSVEAAQRAMAKYGPLQAQVVEQSIAQGWTGLFPLKTNAPGGKPDLCEKNRASGLAWAADMMAIIEGDCREKH